MLTSKGRPLRTLKVRLAALLERVVDLEPEDSEVVGVVESSLVRSIACTSSGERREEERLVEYT
jgi:hypothetical protein